MSDDEKGFFVLVEGLLYPTPVWHGALNEAVMRMVEAQVPEGITIRQVARMLSGFRTVENLHKAQRAACAILAEAGIGVAPERLSGGYHIDAVFPVDNTVPPR